MTQLTSTAVVLTDKGCAELQIFDTRALQDNEIRIANTVTGLSAGTEYLVCSGRMDDCKFPCTLGYQGVGRVVETGPRVTNCAVGDRTLSGINEFQPSHLVDGKGNAHQSHIIMDAGRLQEIADTVSDEHASYTWLVSIAAQGVERGGVSSNDVVAIVGLGLIGQFACQIACAAGAKVYACDLIESRANLAAKRGVQAALTGDATALDGRLRRDHSDGANVVIECTGNNGALDGALNLAAPNGRFVMQGYYPGQVQFRFIVPHEKRLTMHFPCAWGDLGAALNMIATGTVQVAPYLSGEYKPNESAQLYQRLYERDPTLQAAVIRWSD